MKHMDWNALFQKASDRIIQIILLGFFWFVTSLGIITIGASTASLNRSMQAYLYEENKQPLKVFFATFKEYFGVTTRIWSLHVFVVAVLVFDLIYYWLGNSTFDTLGVVAMCVALTIILFECSMVFICIPVYHIQTIKEAFQKSMDVAFRCMIESFSILVLHVAIPVAAFLLLPQTILFVAGIVAYCDWKIIPKMLEKYRFKKGTFDEQHKLESR